MCKQQQVCNLLVPGNLSIDFWRIPIRPFPTMHWAGGGGCSNHKQPSPTASHLCNPVCNTTKTRLLQPMGLHRRRIRTRIGPLLDKIHLRCQHTIRSLIERVAACKCLMCSLERSLRARKQLFLLLFFSSPLKSSIERNWTLSSLLPSLNP